MDLAELFLPGQRETLRQVFPIGPEHFVPEFVPQSVGLGDPLVLLQFIHDLIHHRFQRRLQISVLLLSFDGLQLVRQGYHELFDLGILQSAVSHLLRDLPQEFSGVLRECIPAYRLLTI